MKERTDFVSNSSSCSFIVNDPAAFKNKVLEWSSNCAYDLGHFEMYVTCNSGDKSFFPKTFSDDGWENDGIYRFNVNADDFMSFNDEQLDKIISVELMCDDFDQRNVFVLSIMKKALENSGILVDSSKSEYPLLLEEDDEYNSKSFVENICKAAFNGNILP